MCRNIFFTILPINVGSAVFITNLTNQKDNSVMRKNVSSSFIRKLDFGCGINFTEDSSFKGIVL